MQIEIIIQFYKLFQISKIFFERYTQNSIVVNANTQKNSVDILKVMGFIQSLTSVYFSGHFTALAYVLELA